MKFLLFALLVVPFRDHAAWADDDDDEYQLLMIGGKTTPSTGNKDVEVVVIDDDDDDDDDDVDSSEEDDDLDAADFFGESFESVGTFIGGRPLVCGGGSTSTDLVKCWKYDKASNTWSQESFGLKQGRIDAAAVRLSDDLWWVTGGLNFNGNPLLSTEVYSESSGSFTESFDLPVALEEHVLVRINNSHVLLSTGWPITNSGNRTWIGNVNTKTWQELAQSTVVRENAGGGLITRGNGEKEVVIVGGFDRTTLKDVNSSEVFSLDTLSWRFGPSLSHLLSRQRHIQEGDRTFIMTGGVLNQANATKKIYRYVAASDPANDYWQELDTTLTVARQDHVAIRLPEDYI